MAPPGALRPQDVEQDRRFLDWEKTLVVVDLCSRDGDRIHIRLLFEKHRSMSTGMFFARASRNHLIPGSQNGNACRIFPAGA